MSCSFCTNTIRNAYSRMAGVHEVGVSLAHEEGLIKYDPAKVGGEELRRTLEQVGYTYRDPEKVRSFEEEEVELRTARAGSSSPGRSPPSPPCYRVYGQEDFDRLAFVRRAQRLELGLDEIGEILASRERGDRPCGYVLGIARSRLDDLDRRIAAMRRAPTIFMRSSSAPPTCTTTGEHCQLIEHQQTAVSRG